MTSPFTILAGAGFTGAAGVDFEPSASRRFNMPRATAA